MLNRKKFLKRVLLGLLAVPFAPVAVAKAVEAATKAKPLGLYVDAAESGVLPHGMLQQCFDSLPRVFMGTITITVEASDAIVRAPHESTIEIVNPDDADPVSGPLLTFRGAE